MRNDTRSRTPVFTLSVPLLAVGIAFESDAQEAALDEVVVTARYREERLQDIPIAISAVTAQDMEVRAFNNSYEVAYMVPNVSLRPAQAAFGNTMTGAVSARTTSTSPAHFRRSLERSRRRPSTAARIATSARFRAVRRAFLTAKSLRNLCNVRGSTDGSPRRAAVRDRKDAREPKGRLAGFRKRLDGRDSRVLGHDGEARHRRRRLADQHANQRDF